MTSCVTWWRFRNLNGSLYSLATWSLNGVDVFSLENISMTKTRLTKKKAVDESEQLFTESSSSEEEDIKVPLDRILVEDPASGGEDVLITDIVTKQGKYVRLFLLPFTY